MLVLVLLLSLSLGRAPPPALLLLLLLLPPVVALVHNKPLGEGPTACRLRCTTG